MRTLLIVVLFFVLGALLIIDNGDLILSEGGDMDAFSEKYVTWLDGLYSNLQNITGDVIDMGWIPNSEGNGSIGG